MCPNEPPKMLSKMAALNKVFQTASMRCSLNLHLRSAHEKPQQPNWFDSPTDPELNYIIVSKFSLLGCFGLTISAFCELVYPSKN